MRDIIDDVADDTRVAILYHKVGEGGSVRIQHEFTTYVAYDAWRDRVDLRDWVILDKYTRDFRYTITLAGDRRVRAHDTETILRRLRGLLAFEKQLIIEAIDVAE